MAVFLQGQAQDMSGKMVGIWFPISCFVAIGFEHIPANMFMIPLGMMANADVSVADCFFKNFVPVTWATCLRAASSLPVAIPSPLEGWAAIQCSATSMLP